MQAKAGPTKLQSSHERYAALPAILSLRKSSRMVKNGLVINVSH